MFHALGRKESRVFIFSRLSSKSIVDDHGKAQSQKIFFLEEKRILHSYYIAGILPLVPSCNHSTMTRVCRRFFEWMLGCSHNKIDQPTLKLASPIARVPYSIEMQGSRAIPIHDETTADCIVKWLCDFAAMHIHDPTAPQIILQVATKTQVYETYENDFVTLQPESQAAKFFPRSSSGVLKLPTKSYFLKVWDSNPSTAKFKVRRYLPLSQCQTCVEFIDLRRECHTPETRLAIIAQERLHHEFIRREKTSYYTRRKQAICQVVSGRKQFGCCIMDACTQAVLALPHFVEIDKTSSEACKIPMHVMAALVHGFRPYAFIFTDNFKHGANITIECLHHVLTDMQQEDGSLPRTFYLQLDNTTKQCKNKFVIAYLGLLIAWNLLERVVISFLPVGHTHEDIGIFFPFFRCCWVF
jgi:hypothetical protein